MTDLAWPIVALVAVVLAYLVARGTMLTHQRAAALRVELRSINEERVRECAALSARQDEQAKRLAELRAELDKTENAHALRALTRAK